MLSRPTTEQILLDCREQLLAAIAPAVTDPAAQIAIQMMENVLRNCAARSAHEIAWMHEEAADVIAFARRVASSPSATADLEAAILTWEDGATESRHLDDAVASYHLASACLSAALEAVMQSGDTDSQAAGRALLETRLAHEQQIMGEWTMVGRA